MKCWGLWYGGSSYAAGSIDDIEEFRSIERAREVFEGRYRAGHWQDHGGGLTPCVDQDTSTMLVFLRDPHGEDPYPDFELSFGPRGGVRRVAT